MEQMLILGSSNAVPHIDQANAQLLARTSERAVLIDCGDNPINHFRNFGIPLDHLSDLILTHFHPDHVAATPLLLMDMWLMGRTAPLRIHGLEPVIQRTQAMLDLYEWRRWPGFYPVSFHVIPSQEMSLVLDEPDLRILGSPVCHLIPTLGLRLEYIRSGQTVAYSCDTEPCDAVAHLAKDVDVLIHEATGESVGHSSTAQAACVAKRAGARSLWLIHYAENADRGEMLASAGKVFSGPVSVARDLLSIDLPIS
jgi:ribonuclease Z